MSRAVLVITNAWPDKADSYHGVFIRRMALDLAELGWRSHVLVPRILPAKAFPRERHEQLHSAAFPFLSAQKLLIEYERVPYIRLTSLLTVGLTSAVATIIRERCSLVHAHWAFPAGLIGLAAARLTGKPFLLTIHGSDQRLAAERGGLAAKAFSIAARGANRVISVSTPISDYLLKIGVSADRIFTRPLGVDPGIFHPAAPPEEDHSDSFTVLSTRNLLPLYRLGDLLRAASIVKDRLPGLKLVLAGEGAERANLERMGRELGLTGILHFAGRLPQQAIARLLAEASVYVSTSPAEGTSVSLLEAMAAGCTPVVVDISSNRAWVEPGVNGLLFPAGDIERLAGSLLRAAGDSALRKRARESGPAVVAERGLWRDQIKLVDRLYRELSEG